MLQVSEEEPGIDSTCSVYRKEKSSSNRQWEDTTRVKERDYESVWLGVSTKPEDTDSTVVTNYDCMN